MKEVGIVKVLQINSVCGVGSTGRIVMDIHQTLIEHGHESYIAYGRGPNKTGDSFFRIGTTADNYVNVALTRIFDNHGFGLKEATRKFIKMVDELSPDVIHLHNIHGYYINIEVLFEYLGTLNIPVVWTLHDCWAFTGHCAYFDYICCYRWKSGCYNCPQKDMYPSSIMMDSSRKNYLRKMELFTKVESMVIVTPSQWLAGLVRESFFKDYPVQVINNGIDLDVFKPTASDFRQRHGLSGKVIILGVASVWEDRKGFKYFVELSKMIDDDYMIVLVGLSENQVKGLPKNILGITKTNNVVELAKVYSAADVFVNPTLEDNFPTVNLEALACGTPIITFNTGGSAECIDDTTGVVVGKDKLYELKNAIEIINKAGGKAYYTEECVKRVLRFYNKKECFCDYLRLYGHIFSAIASTEK